MLLSLLLWCMHGWLPSFYSEMTTQEKSLQIPFGDCYDYTVSMYQNYYNSWWRNLWKILDSIMHYELRINEVYRLNQLFWVLVSIKYIKKMLFDRCMCISGFYCTKNDTFKLSYFCFSSRMSNKQISLSTGRKIELNAKKSSNWFLHKSGLVL
jgi:hypothetical protein